MAVPHQVVGMLRGDENGLQTAHAPNLGLSIFGADGDGDLQFRVELAKSSGRFELYGEVSFDFGLPASGKDSEDLPRQVVGRAEIGIRSVVGDGSGERVAYVFDVERRLFKTFFFEGKNREEEVECFCHFGDPVFSPRPDGWANVVDQFAAVAFFAERPFEAEIESGVIDADDGFRLELQNGVAEGVELAEDPRHREEDVGKSHDLQCLHRGDRLDRKLAHPGS